MTVARDPVVASHIRVKPLGEPVELQTIIRFFAFLVRVHRREQGLGGAKIFLGNINNGETLRDRQPVRTSWIARVLHEAIK